MATARSPEVIIRKDVGRFGRDWRAKGIEIELASAGRANEVDTRDNGVGLPGVLPEGGGIVTHHAASSTSDPRISEHPPRALSGY